MPGCAGGQSCQPPAQPWTRRTLVHKLQCKLYLAGCLGRQNVVKSRRTDIAVREPEVCAVQDIEHLRSELKLHRTCHLKIFERGKVPVRITGALIDVSAFGAKLASVGHRIKPVKGACVEPGIHRT